MKWRQHFSVAETKYRTSVVTSGEGDEESIAEYLNHFLMISGIQAARSLYLYI
jgi:hypothetical protein